MAGPDIKISKSGLTDKEIALLIATVKYNSSELKVNWDAAAEEVGYKEGRDARDMFKKLKAKIGVGPVMDRPASATTSNARVSSSNNGSLFGNHNTKTKKIKEEIIEDQDDDLDDDDLAPFS